METVRISHLLNNGSFVVTEDSDDNPYDGVDLVSVPYNKLVETCMYYIENEVEREETRKKNFHQYKEKFAMTDLLKKVL